VPRPHGLLETLRTVTPFRSPKSPANAKFRSQTRESCPAIGIHSKPPFEPRPPRPDIDQSVNIMAESGVILDPAFLFEQLLSSNPAVVAGHPLFSLPASIRRQIYGFCFPLETRKISLSPRFATKAVWANGHFASPWDILEDIMGGLGSFKALRRDLMTYFWAEYHFHVTLTPFNGPRFSPLSHVWMQNHLGLVQRLTVEADLTRFGGSQLADAPKFGYNVEKIEGILADIVKGISMRAHWIPMAEFNLMCRRFEGSRPLRVAAGERHSTVSEPSSTSSRDGE
jgi:hypothetical protein